MLHRARRALVRAGDPRIRFRLGKSEILLPLSHDLPHYCATWPLYSTNLGRIASCISDYTTDFTVIDIGANVGDSAAILRGEVDAPILCVEGNRDFLPLLRENLERIGGEFELADCFVGPATTGEIYGQSGTARIAPSLTGTALRMRSLRELVEDHPRFAGAKLVKIDTDGFDCSIIRNDLPTLQGMHSIVFFEYAPKLTRLIGDRCDGLLRQLGAGGYRHALLFDHVGTFLFGLCLDDEETIQDVERYYARRDDVYADICVFPDEDTHIFDEIRQRERNSLTQDVR
jgi:FkbM family methyltransferase